MKARIPAETIAAAKTAAETAEVLVKPQPSKHESVYDVTLTLDANLMYDRDRQTAIKELFATFGGELQKIQFIKGKANITGSLKTLMPKPIFMQTTWSAFYAAIQSHYVYYATVSKHKEPIAA